MGGRTGLRQHLRPVKHFGPLELKVCEDGAPPASAPWLRYDFLLEGCSSSPSSLSLLTFVRKMNTRVATFHQEHYAQTFHELLPGI